MSDRWSWLSSLPYLSRVCLHLRTQTPFTDPWSGHSGVFPWIGGLSSGDCCHGNCRGNRRQTWGRGWLPGVKTLDEKQRQCYTHSPCGTGVPWDQKLEELWGGWLVKRATAVGRVSPRGSPAGSLHLFFFQSMSNYCFYQDFICCWPAQPVLNIKVWKL